MRVWLIRSLPSLSAGLIFLFYVAFYTFLAGLFVLTMYVMLQTLDDHKPTQQDRLTTPGAARDQTEGHGLQQGADPPLLPLSFTGMVIRPKADETFEIVYSIQKTESWDMYAQALDKFLARKSNPIMRVTSAEHLVPDGESFLPNR